MAKYYDASDQCSLSRIWGGIHPPVDDLRGRVIGDQIGLDALAMSYSFFNRTHADFPEAPQSRFDFGPNPLSASEGASLGIVMHRPDDLDKTVTVINSTGEVMKEQTYHYVTSFELDLYDLALGIYFVRVQTSKYTEVFKIAMEY